MNQHPDEWLDLVDEKDVVIGKKKRADVYAEDLNNFRVVNVFVINDRGELWLPRRAPTKALFPLCLDVGAAGHVESGETYEQTFKRETAEELNVDVDTVPHRLLGHLTPKDGVSAFMAVYEIQVTDAPDFNKNDFTEYFWMTPKDFFERYKKGEKVKGDLPQLMRSFYKTSST